MCDPITIGAALGGVLLGGATSPKMPTPKIPDPVKPPQPSKAPDRAAMGATKSAGAGPAGTPGGNAGTFLTGPSGIDPKTLNLGSNVLLGQ